MTIDELLADDSLPKTESEILLAEILKVDRSFLSGFPEKMVSTAEKNKFQRSKKERLQSKPIPYILGYREFYGRNFLVNEDVLIPRPETENLIDNVLRFCQGKQLTVVDLGTGSGCIAITLACKNPKLRLIASDVSLKALELAKKNAKLHQVNSRIKFIQSDILTDIDPPIDLIVTNLPYIPSKNWLKLPAEIKQYEPRIALDSGITKDSLYQKLFLQAKSKLTSSGRIIYELDGDILEAKI